MNSSALVRSVMAAGMYVLLMSGYMILPTPQLFAVFAAMISCAMLVFWVNETKAETVGQMSDAEAVRDLDQMLSPHQQSNSAASLEAAAQRLDLLKAELMVQYAQFGRDQRQLNGPSLGSWHRQRGPQPDQGDR